ncbi:MAG TPA: 23S rRNA (pseudouridine(1915)-N(3))-methyltransferase RlmH [Polyangia bacterium]|nr:23S rRNA (pseudouridine(1915)-N(3))-methyltransferase RlmH [Polyangia bacterium]
MKIVVLAVGKLRDRHLATLIDDYVTRARHHLPLEIVEVEDDAALARRWPDGGEVIALEVTGESWSTELLARQLERRMTRGTRTLTFVIGGADGIPAPLSARAGVRLSLSALTLPHRLARLILCEQIYRALTIIRGEPYHH